MVMCAIDVVSLSLMVLKIVTTFPNDNVNMAAYADDSTAGLSIKSLKHCWDTLFSLGPKLAITQRQRNPSNSSKRISKRQSNKIVSSSNNINRKEAPPSNYW